ncbi:MAG TPA: ribose-5-phosphate isomerase RpiA [Blastocatellia bacterium]|nr:ribose-5-phosphate isomerase RpiA [Blastocatellia bacterium]
MKDESKKRAAERGIEMIQDGQVVGLGTGSTAKFAIEGLARLASQGLSFTGVPTSIATQKLATDLGIPLLDLNEVNGIDVTLDGADEIDSDFNMIKGGGGALTREKLVALASKTRVILVDESKLVTRLGAARTLPIEVLSFSWKFSARLLDQMGCSVSLRTLGTEPFLSDNGHYILDCDFGAIDDAPALERQIKLVPGVIESGLFIGIADTLVVGFDDRVEMRERR